MHMVFMGCLICSRRKEPIIAIGGGVCLDVAGLAANLYRRNTPLIKIPTTVMAAVDASIGIKTAVNFHGRKNKMGTYCAPLAVFIDKTFLKTLGARHLSNGSAEILKMACIKDAELFDLLEKHSKDLVQSHFQVCSLLMTSLHAPLHACLHAALCARTAEAHGLSIDDMGLHMLHASAHCSHSAYYHYMKCASSPSSLIS